MKPRRALPGVGILRSVGVSMRHAFQRKVTVQYPDEAPAMGYRFRGRHIFHQDVCIGCTQCERVCPVIAIKMEEHKDPGTRKVVVDRFAIDLGICYYCGLCEEVCPTDPKAVHLGPDFELATHDRRLLVYEMDQLVGPKPLPLKPKIAEAPGANGDGAGEVAPRPAPPVQAAKPPGPAAEPAAPSAPTPTAPSTPAAAAPSGPAPAASPGADAGATEAPSEPAAPEAGQPETEAKPD